MHHIITISRKSFLRYNIVSFPIRYHIYHALHSIAPSNQAAFVFCSAHSRRLSAFTRFARLSRTRLPPLLFLPLPPLVESFFQQHVTRGGELGFSSYLLP